MGFYKKGTFTLCDGCRICVGKDCAIEKDLHTVGEYKICGSCDKELEEKGFIDLDVSHNSTFWLRLFLDGTTKRMKRIYWIRTREFETVEADHQIPVGAVLFQEFPIQKREWAHGDN